MKNKKIIIYVILVIITFFFNIEVYGVNREDFGNITLDLKDVDILDVLNIFSMHSGLSIVAGQDVRTKVTIFLKDVNAWDAFEIVLAANNLAYVKEGPIIKVLTERNYLRQYGRPFYDETIIETVNLENARAEDVSNALNQIRSEVGRIIVDARSNTVTIKDTPEMVSRMKEVIRSIEIAPQTKVFDLKYADPDEMLEKVRQQLTEGIGHVEVDRRTGKLIVSDIPPKIRQIDKMLSSFDDRSKEVLIEAKIVEVTLSQDHRLGIDWNSVFRNLGIGVNIEHGDLVYSTDIPEGGFPIVLDAFKTMGEVRVVSKPRILALNHEEANIKIAERRPYVTTHVSELGRDATQIAESVTFLDIGTQLSVTPTINPDGFITMKIAPKISSAAESFTYDSTVGGISVERRIPIEKTTEAETTVMVKDGSTIIIGGLMKESEIINKKRVPVISNVPFLGGLFRHETTETAVSELTIFLTPRIVTGEESIELAKLEKDIQLPEVDDKKPTFSWLKKGEKSAYTDYYLALSSILSEYIASNYTPTERGGRVNLILNLNRNGRLIDDPHIIDATSRDMANAASRLVKQAAPFPPFPEEMREREEKFRISINLPAGLEDRRYTFEKEKPRQEHFTFSAQDMAYSEYYLTLSELISEYISRNYPSAEGGKVEILFTLSRDGRLIGRPEVLNIVRPHLRELTIETMRELSPFPPFPEGIRVAEKEFRILINIPDRRVSKSQTNPSRINNLHAFSTGYSENPEALSYNDYRRFISEQISKLIESPGSSSGIVKVKFALNNQGELVGMPEILETPDKLLSDLTIEAVKKAAPFPKMPRDISRDEATFEISIVYR